MSIAVSAVVRPSRMLLVATFGMCLLVMACGCLIGLGQVGRLALPLRLLLSLTCIFLALFVCYRTVRNRKTHHIDISGRGQIRLMENSATAGPNAKLVTLLADSTFWPGLLLLRLQNEDGNTIVLPVLPDSVEGGGFRHLAVACRWIAAHNNPVDHTHP